MNAFAPNRHLLISPDTGMLCVTILVAPQLFGGAFPWTVLAIAGLALASLGVTLWVRRSAATPTMDGVPIMMGIAWIWTCLQAVPLPAGVARAIGAGSVASAGRLHDLAWADAVALTISYEPGSTHLQILIGIAILTAFLAARHGGDAALKPLAVATVISAVLMGLVGVAHEAVGASSLFGIYAPRFTTTRVLAPLMNSNHLAGFSLLGALIAAGLAVEETRSRGRLAWVAASVFCATVVTLTLSRGAIGAILFGFLVLATWLFSRDRRESRRAMIPVAVVSASVAAVLAFAGLEPILRRFENEGLGKLQLAGRGLHLLDGSTWLVGVGRGAFSSAFVTHEGSFDRYTHPENFVVQWTTEWGAPVALALLVVIGVALWKRFRGTDDPLTAAVCIAIFALTLQNLVDFSLEMAGVVVVVAALLGAVLPAPTPPHPRRNRTFGFVSFAVFIALLAALGPGVLQSDTQSFVDRLARAMDSDDDAAFEATLRRGLYLHPGEPALALLAGAYAGSKRHPDAARWLLVAMEEAPDWAAPHVVAAQWLFTEGRTDQALLEIREAEERRPGTARAELCELLTRFPLMEHLERAAPIQGERVGFLDRTVASCPALPAELRQQIDSAILKEDPTRAAAALREAQRLIGEERVDEAMELLDGSLESNPDDVRLWISLVGANLKAGDDERAFTLLKEARSRGLDSIALDETKARVEAAFGYIDQMRATLIHVRGQSRGDARMIARSFMLEGELEASLGNVDEALAAYEAADLANPASAALQVAASLALRLGRPTYARRAYGKLCTRQPEGPWCLQEAGLSKELRKGPVEPLNP